jgi:hypothetical protein
MSNAIPAGYEYHVVAPTNHAGLTCRFLKPADFKIAELPPSETNFSDGGVFLPLAVALTQYGPMVFTVAARPAYDDGAVSQWLEYICRKEGYEHSPVTEIRIGDLPAVTCDALQKADDVTMKMRFVLFEDGGRLFQMSAMAPEALWSSAIEKLAPMLSSLELREPRGTKVPLKPGAPPPTQKPEKSAEAPAPAPVAAKPADDAPATPPGKSAAPTARLTTAELIALALAEDASSLDSENQMNVNLRNRGAGLVPRVSKVDKATKSALVAAAAVQGSFRVPFGWHVIDDGKRTLVFDAGGQIQVNLSQRLREGESTRDFARGCLQQYLDLQPDLKQAELELDGIAGAGVRDAKIESETLDQYFLVRDIGRTNLFLVARVTAKSEDATRALNLAGDIMATFDGPPSDRR